MKELIEIQHKLNAPKTQFNNFGKYSYRNVEDILMAVKPLLFDNNCTITITDEIIMVGDRHYIKAIATIKNKEGKEVSTTAFAREPLSKKGMDDSQITGAASSYARKYALNGLLLIDDNKDADSHDNTTKEPTIYDKINATTDLDVLQKIWDNNRQLQNTREFIDTIKKQKQKLCSNK